MFLGRAVVRKAALADVTVVAKVIHDGFSSTDKKLFAKEAKLLHDINHENIVKIVGVTEDPIAIVMEFLHFDFRPFSREGSFSNLDDLLSYMNDEVIFFHFPKLACFMAKDLLSAVEFLHKNNMVHRDIKANNILLSNLHYAKDTLQEMVKTRPIICKLGDLGEARSQFLQT